MGGLPRCARKKLIAWVRWITDADGVGPRYCAHCRAARAGNSPCAACPEPDLLPENVAAARLFLDCQTQWVYSGMGGIRTGLNYAGVEAVMRLRDVIEEADCFMRLQILEAELLRIDEEARK